MKTKTLIALAMAATVSTAAQAHTVKSFYDGMEGGAASPVWIAAEAHFFGIVDDMADAGEICIDAPVWRNTIDELGIFISTVSDIRWNRKHQMGEQIENLLVPQLQQAWPCG
jgi:hypothetical protein